MKARKSLEGWLSCRPKGQAIYNGVGGWRILGELAPGNKLPEKHNKTTTRK